MEPAVYPGKTGSAPVLYDTGVQFSTKYPGAGSAGAVPLLYLHGTVRYE
jgi:hypothetical protein